MSRRAPRPGDVVGAHVWVGPLRVFHVGIVSVVAAGGRVRVISNSLKLGRVSEESSEDFAQGGEVKLVEGVRGRFPGQVVVQRARSRMGDPYSVFSSNCEHFVRWAHGLVEESPQLQAGVLVAGVLASLAVVVVAAREG